MVAATPELMTTLPTLRIPTDEDFDNYSAYVSKLAASASEERPSVTPFRVWFFWRYNAWPVTQLIRDGDDFNPVSPSSLQVQASSPRSALHGKPDSPRDALAYQQPPGLAAC